MADSSSSVIRAAGDINVSEINIISRTGSIVNITAQVGNLQIFESVSSPFISGSVVIHESLDFLTKLKMIGDEIIYIKATTPSFDRAELMIDAAFHVYKLSDFTMRGDRSCSYMLHFISVEALVDQNRRVSRAFEGRVSDLANANLTSEQIGLGSKKRVFVEETSNNIKYISNYWSPVQNLNYLTDHAINKNNVPTFAMFENKYGFNFGSFDAMFEQPVYQTFIRDNFIRDPADNGLKNIEEDYKRIREMSIPYIFDYMDDVISGAYGSRSFCYDYVTKRYNSKEYFYDADVNGNKLKNTDEQLLAKSGGAIFDTRKHYGLFTGRKEDSDADYIQKRISRLKRIESTKVNITVPGRTDYTVGRIVQLNIPSMDEGLSDISGKYIISALNHHITKTEHICVMELIK